MQLLFSSFDMNPLMSLSLPFSLIRALFLAKVVLIFPVRTVLSFSNF
jgi:hypothetical protein